MGAMTIRRIDDETKELLRRRAHETGRSMEAEVRHILRRDLGRDRASEYPDGMIARAGESWVQHLMRVSDADADLVLPERSVEDRPSPFE